MTASPALAIDRVDRIDPRVQEQPERRRRATRPFPELDKDGGKHEPAEPPAEPPAPRDDDDPDEPHLIDLLVRGLLPTRQILPGCTRAGRPN